jgi:four helix bundle protein
MDGYRALGAWQCAARLNDETLAATDSRSHPKTWAVLDQLRRAAISTDVNIVEGYALGTRALFRRHLRIALGSAAEAERLVQIAARRGYLDQEVVRRLSHHANATIRALYGLLRSPNLKGRPDPK